MLLLWSRDTQVSEHAHSCCCPFLLVYTRILCCTLSPSIIRCSRCGQLLVAAMLKILHIKKLSLIQDFYCLCSENNSISIMLRIVIFICGPSTVSERRIKIKTNKRFTNSFFKEILCEDNAIVWILNYVHLFRYDGVSLSLSS